MGSSVRKKSKAERQADAGAEVRSNKKVIIATIPEDHEEVSLDELLDAADNEPTEAVYKKGLIGKSTTVSRQRTSKGQMVTFTNKKDQRITGPGVRYWVVRDSNGKLHYKEESQVIFLPDDWKEGDVIDWSQRPIKETPIKKETPKQAPVAQPAIGDSDEDLDDLL